MKQSLFITVFLLAMATSMANNIQLTNVSTVISGNNVMLEFDLSWENSWRVASTNNYDGAWIFFKFKDNDGRWKPIRFSGSNLSISAGYIISISNNSGTDGVGAFIYRSANGSGNVSLTNIRAGIDPLPGTYEVKGFAIEMVYIPQGGFYAGDHTSAGFYEGNDTLDAYQVTGNQIILGNFSGNLNGTGYSKTITNYATGVSHYWLMKYELSCGAYRDFLNTLTYNQQIRRMIFPPNSGTGNPAIYSNSRLDLEIATPGVSPSTPAVLGCDADNDNVYNEVDDGEWVALSGIYWPDAAAYLDWAGLRPMTELEYEKACRGPQTNMGVQGEFAWGNSSIASILYTISNPLRANEVVTNSSSTEGNAVVISTAGSNKTMRGGIFATSLSTRISSGAGYYGAMELTGNSIELCVSLNHVAGHDFTAKKGNGILNELGNADENYWPGMNGNSNANTPGSVYDGVNGVTGVAGVCIKGGAYGPSTPQSVSKRSTGNIASVGTTPYGIRGVRDAD